MAKVFLHTREAVGKTWRQDGREFLRLPIKGEFITLDANGAMYEVNFVIHCPHIPPSDYAAEVFATKSDRLVD